MATVSLLFARLFGDRYTRESLQREGAGIWVFALIADCTGYLAVLGALSLFERIF